MPLNSQHCHTDLMKIAQFVLSFSTPTPVVANRELKVGRSRFDLLRGIVIGLMRPAEALRSSGQIEADACSRLA
jgi:hypothetical protein